jgi:hypothetical protein
LHSFAKGFHSAMTVATDAPTLGVMDKLFSALPRPAQTGNPFSPTGDPQADTAQAYKDVGYAALPLSIAGSAVTGLPELKAASAIGEAAAPYVGKWAGGVLGSGAVGAGTGAVGAYGHEQGLTPDAGDIAKGAEWGGALGALSGVPGGVVRGKPLPPSVSADALKSQASAAYKPLENILYNSSSEVHPALDQIDAQKSLKDWSGLKWADAPKTQTEIKTLTKPPGVSANDIQQTQGALKDIMRNPNASANDQNYAGYFHDQLQGVLENGLPSTGVPQNLPSDPAFLGGQGVTPSNYAAWVKGQGDVLHGQAQDMARLDQMVAKSQVTGGPDVGQQSRSYLTSNEGQNLAPPSSPQYQAYNALAGTAADPGKIPWMVKHYMVAPAIGMGANEVYDLLSGEEHHTPLEHVMMDAAIGGGLLVGQGTYGWATRRANQLAQQRALDAARSTFTTGSFQAPLDSGAAFRNAIRSLVYRQGDVGGF